MSAYVDNLHSFFLLDSVKSAARQLAVYSFWVITLLNCTLCSYCSNTTGQWLVFVFKLLLVTTNRCLDCAYCFLLVILICLNRFSFSADRYKLTCDMALNTSSSIDKFLNCPSRIVFELSSSLYDLFSWFFFYIIQIICHRLLIYRSNQLLSCGSSNTWSHRVCGWNVQTDFYMSFTHREFLILMSLSWVCKKWLFCDFIFLI